MGMYTTGSLDYKMLVARRSAASVVLNNSTLWIVGGINYPEPGDEHVTVFSTTEFVTFDFAPIEGPILPFCVAQHSMIQYDEKTIFLIGGSQDCATSNKTWILGTY